MVTAGTIEPVFWICSTVPKTEEFIERRWLADEHKPLDFISQQINCKQNIAFFYQEEKTEILTPLHCVPDNN